MTMRGVSFIFIIFSRSLAAFRTSCDSHLNQTTCNHFSYLLSIDVLRYIIIGPLRPSCLFPLQVAFVKNVNSCPVTVAILLVTNHIGLPTYVGRWHSFCLHIGISDLHIIPLLLCVWLLLPPTLGVPMPRYAEEDTVPAQSLPLHIRQTKKSIGSGLLSIFTRTRLLPFPPQFYTTLSKTRLILSPSVPIVGAPMSASFLICLLRLPYHTSASATRTFTWDLFSQSSLSFLFLGSLVSQTSICFSYNQNGNLLRSKLNTIFNVND